MHFESVSYTKTGADHAEEADSGWGGRCFWRAIAMDGIMDGSFEAQAFWRNELWIFWSSAGSGLDSSRPVQMKLFPFRTGFGIESLNRNKLR